jgi:Protein of unknown function (DUF3574)
MRALRFRLWLPSAVVAIALAGCVTHRAPVATVSEPPCADGGYRSTAELVFGRVSNDGAGGVSEAQFAQFLDTEVSPRFPAGLTAIDAEGRWTPPAGSMIREPAKLVMIVLPGDRDDERKLDAVREAYKSEFHQQSVLLMTHGDCVSF